MCLLILHSCLDFSLDVLQISDERDSQTQSLLRQVLDRVDSMGLDVWACSSSLRMPLFVENGFSEYGEIDTDSESLWTLRRAIIGTCTRRHTSTHMASGRISGRRWRPLCITSTREKAYVQVHIRIAMFNAVALSAPGCGWRFAEALLRRKSKPAISNWI